MQKRHLQLFQDPDHLLELAVAHTGTGRGNSYWTEYVRCPRAHRLRWKDGVHPIEQHKAFALGSLVHSVLAYVALGAQHGVAVKWGRVLMVARERKLYKLECIAEARRLMQPYFLTYSERNAGYPGGAQILGVEHYLETRLGEKTYSARLDVLLRMKNMSVGYSKYNTKNRLVVADHKTSAWGDKKKTNVELADLWRTKPQFLGHAYLIRKHFGGEIPLVMINQIIKTQIPSYRRWYIDFDDDDIDKWADEHKSREQQLGHGQDWMNYSQCVPGIGDPCWAFKWCHGTAGDRKKLYKVVK